MPVSIMAPGTMSDRLALTVLPPLSLYIHIPWCVRKCPYCDFNSHEAKGGSGAIPERQYIDALISDLDHTLPAIWGRRVYTVFFGGGTPSIFSAQAIDEILAAVRARVSLDSEAEITMESNPGTFEVEKFRGFREAGVNRLSIGIQSFNATMTNLLPNFNPIPTAVHSITARWCWSCTQTTRIRSSPMAHGLEK